MAKTVSANSVPLESIKGAKELIRVYMAADIPVFLHGAPGVGKSDALRQIATEQKIGFKDLRLSMMDPVDLLGLPVVTADGETTWAKPAFWPNEKKDGERGIVLFDELTDIGRSMQSAAYQIILNRCAGPHKLPKGWYPCAAGNRREDKAAAQAMSSALGNRFAHIDVTPDPAAFREWGNINGINPLIIAFIQARPTMLHTMEGSDLRAFATPRSWAKASLVIDNDPSIRYKLLSGLIGAGVAGELEAFMKTIDMPSLEEIVDAPKKCRIPKEPSSRYACAAMLSQNAIKDGLKGGNFSQICTYISRAEYGRDFEILTVLDASKRDASLTETKAFIEFANRNSDLHL